MFKKSVKVIFIFLLVLLLSAIVLRNQLCEKLIFTATSKATGLRLSIQKLNLDILNNTLRMQGITVLNPQGFNGEVLANIEEIIINYNLLGSLSGKLHLNQAKFKINELNIIRNSKGRSNIASFKNTPAKKKTILNTSMMTPRNSETQDKKESKKTARPKIKIDHLEIFLKKAIFTDYRAKVGQPAVIVFTSKQPFLFKNVGYLDLVVKSVSAEEGFGNLLEGFWR